MHLMHSGSDQCRQTFLTTLEITRWKNPAYGCYTSDLYKRHFLKMFFFGFRCKSHWIFPHVNTFAYLSKGGLTFIAAERTFSVQWTLM